MSAFSGFLIGVAAWLPSGGGAQLVAHPPVERPRDPWVFRSVLDERARMISVALHEGLWIAYDASTCSLYGAWGGGVDLEGAVYDTVHGPQPTRSRPLWLAPETGPDGVPVTPWRVVRKADGEQLDLRARYRGYRFLQDEEGGEQVEFWWQFELPGQVLVDVREQPNGVANPDTGRHPRLSHLWLSRSFEVSGLPEGLELQFPSGVWTTGFDEPGFEAARRRGAWSGTACAVAGHGDGICSWEGAESQTGDSLTLEGQRSRLSAYAERVEGWRASDPDWQPSWVSLVGNGSGYVYMTLDPLELESREGEGEGGEDER